MATSTQTDRQTIRLGVVGAAGRGGSFLENARALGLDLAAICDADAERLEAARKQCGARHAFTDYQQMLDSGQIDAVVVGTPMQLHAEQCTAALERGVHVLSEVTAAVSVDQCKQIVRAAEASSAIYMMAENVNYLRPNLFVQSLVKAGLFGEVYYAEGEYLHEIKERCEATPWRRKWLVGTHGITYGTHSLGPILSWMEGDRVARVCCEESGSHHRDSQGEPYICDTAVMLCKTVQGRLIKVRMDLVSDRPHAGNLFQLQGTDGVYESSRGGPEEVDRIWLREVEADHSKWLKLEDVMARPEFDAHLLPDWCDRAAAAEHTSGHGGGDYLVLEAFARSVRGEIDCPVDIHRTMDMTLPGLLSEQSVLEGGQWVDVPDSRDWV